jgi:hypothetical protein
MSDATKPNHLAAAALNFWLELKLSAFNLGYYRHLRRAPVGGGVRYFVQLHLALAALISVTFLPSIFGLPAAARQFVTDKVPADASFEVKAGRLTTNLPADWTATEGDYLFVASTLAGTSATLAGTDQRLVGKKNWVMFAPDAIFIMDQDAGLRVSELKGYADARYTRDQVLSWIGSALPWWLALVALLAFGAVFGWLSLTHAAGVLILCWLAAAYGRLLRLNLSLGQWQNMGWRMATTPALVGTALLVARVSVPFAFTVIFLMFVMAIAADEKADPAI